MVVVAALPAITVQQRLGGRASRQACKVALLMHPAHCLPPGNQIPPVGTRVEYDVVPDPKTGKTKADNVRPAWQPRKDVYQSTRHLGITVNLLMVFCAYGLFPMCTGRGISSALLA